MVADMAHDALAMVEYGAKPAALIVADDENAAGRACRMAELAGCRVTGSVEVGAAIERLDRITAVDVVIADLEQEQDATGRLLERLQTDLDLSRYGVVIVSSTELIDQVAATVTHRRAYHLSDPSELQQVEAIAEAAERAPARLQDVGKGQLRQLSEEAAKLASMLASLSEAASDDEAPLPQAGQNGIDSGRIRAMIRARRLRDQFFGADLFADPAWDMLLDLMAARLEGQKVAVSSLCIAAAVPATTALRWIKTLTDQGLFLRVADHQDGRRVYIELSGQAAQALTAYLQAVQRLSPIAV